MGANCFPLQCSHAHSFNALEVFTFAANMGILCLQRVYWTQFEELAFLCLHKADNAGINQMCWISFNIFCTVSIPVKGLFLICWHWLCQVDYA